MNRKREYKDSLIRRRKACGYEIQVPYCMHSTLKYYI
jgi:hypothetical protein